MATLQWSSKYYKAKLSLQIIDVIKIASERMYF